MPELPRFIARAAADGTNFKSEMACSTRVRVSVVTLSGVFRTRLTVATETPDRVATSRKLDRFLIGLRIMSARLSQNVDLRNRLHAQCN